MAQEKWNYFIEVFESEFMFRRMQHSFSGIIKAICCNVNVHESAAAILYQYSNKPL